MTTQRTAESGIIQKQLPNGLTVLFKEDHAAPIVAVNVWFGVGSVHESEVMNGLAHFQEHMVFKGTEKHGVGDIARIVKSHGGNLNAGTSYSYTMYYVVLPSDNFGTALEVQADAMMHSTFDPEEFTKERLVVIDEARMYDDRPESFTFYRTMELGFDKHTYRRPIAGYQDIVEKITRDQLVEFYNNYYRPSNAVLVVVGDVDADTAMAEIEKTYGVWKSGKVTINEPPVEPAQRAFRFKAYEGPQDHAYLGAGFHVPSLLDEDYPALQMLAELLSAGRSSRLYRRVREEKQLVTSVSADMLAEKWPGFFLVSGSMPREKWEPACEAIFAEMERFKHERASEEELDKARRQVERAMFKELETMEGQASNLGYYQLLGDYQLADRHREAIKRVSAERVMEVARKYFHPDNLSLVAYTPKESAQGMVSEAEVTKIVTRTLTSQGGVHDVTAASRLALHDTAIPAAKRSSRASGGVTKFTLANGVRVLLKPRPDVPLVSILTTFPGGGRYEPAGKSGLAMLTHRVLTKGSARFSAEEIAARIEGLGGGIDSYSSFDSGGVAMGVLSEYAEDAVEIYRDVLRAPKFDAARVEQEKTRLLEELARRHDNPIQFTLDHLFRSTFGDHPYAYPFLGDAAQTKQLGAADCSNWYQSLLTPDRVVLSMVGDMTLERARSVAERLLGDLPAGKAATARADAAANPVKPGEHVLRRDGIKQSVVFVGFPAPKLLSEEAKALEVLNGVLTGLGGRLFVELRDKRSLGYMTGSAFNPLFQRGIFFGYANPGAEGVEEAVRVILHELDLVTREPVSDDEISLSKEWLVGSHVMELQRNGAQAAEYGILEALGFGYETVDKVPGFILGVTKEQMMAVAKQVFDPKRAVIVKMLPE
ncbi:MAG TPA: pitrilysin family protein [Candidatus Krumholzibacteria bacterium]|nr:pitrilysin family protein [Candidatus Krumholzibacteria bacterium]